MIACSRSLCRTDEREQVMTITIGEGEYRYEVTENWGEHVVPLGLKSPLAIEHLDAVLSRSAM